MQTLQTWQVFAVPFTSSNCFQDITSRLLPRELPVHQHISPKNDGERNIDQPLPNNFRFGHTNPDGKVPWTGGTSIVQAGSVTVDSARFNTVSPTTTFSGRQYGNSRIWCRYIQHIGFGGGTDATKQAAFYNGENPWAMFSTGDPPQYWKQEYRHRNFIMITRYSGILYRSKPCTGYNGMQTALTSLHWWKPGAYTVQPSVNTMRPAVSDYNNGWW